MENNTFTPTEESALKPHLANVQEAAPDYCDLELEAADENSYLQTDFEADLDLKLPEVDPAKDPRVPVPPSHLPDPNSSTILHEAPPLSWSFTSLQSNASMYQAVLSGTSDRYFLKKAVDRLETVIANCNLLSKAPYGIAPKPTTYSYPDADGSIVTQTMITTASPNDYVSLATYWWPDPNATNGLPYIAHDGKINPETTAIPDHKLLRSICNDTQLLGLAYYFTKKEEYATQAIALLRAFFIEPKTRMNPHLMYAQVIKGVNNGFGRCIGFVDAELLPELLNGYQLLQESMAFQAAPEVDKGMKDWFRQFWQWLTTHYETVPPKNSEAFYHYQMMKEIKSVYNNIRTAYELLVISYAQFIGEDAWAEKEINAVFKDSDTTKGLISQQILPAPGIFKFKDKTGLEKEYPVPAGAMYKELKRTKPAGYCQKNLDLLLRLCTLAENAGIDLWNYTSPTGSSVKKAVEAMLHFSLNPQEWPRSEYEPLTDPNVYKLFRNSMRKASGIWVEDKDLQNKIQTYLTQLDELLGENSGYSETAYRKGLDWQLLIHKIGYSF